MYKTERKALHITFRCIWRHVNFAFAMPKSFYLEKKCYHTCEENKIKILSHQNCPTTIQSKVFTMNIIFYQDHFYFFHKRAAFILYQGKLTKPNGQ